MIRCVLWDIDGTLLEFPIAERSALTAVFQAFHLGPCGQDQLNLYHFCNKCWWRAMERGATTQKELLTARFEDYFATEGLPFTGDYRTVNKFYQEQLGEVVLFHDHAWEVVSTLGKEGTVQCAVTNGTQVAQRKRLARSGLDTLMNGGIYISEELGWNKPSPKFFQSVLVSLYERLWRLAQDEILLVGDSLSSDMLGAMGVGIHSCWYDPENQPIPQDLHIEFHIQHLDQVLDIVRRENENPTSKPSLW